MNDEDFEMTCEISCYECPYHEIEDRPVYIGKDAAGNPIIDYEATLVCTIKEWHKNY